MTLELTDKEPTFPHQNLKVRDQLLCFFLISVVKLTSFFKKDFTMKKLVLITGSSTGIGFSTLKKFVDNKHNVLAHYYEETEAFTNYVESNENVTKIYSDFGDDQSLNDFLKTISNYNDFLALVNCAGCFDFSKRENERIKEARKVFQINTISATLIAEEIFNKMKTQKMGNIINISSGGVKFGSDVQNVFYGASKSALESVTRSFSRVGAPFNVLVNTLRPGVTDSGQHKKIGKDLNNRVKLIPMKRAARPNEIAEMIYFLAVKNTFISGEIISVTGGE